MPLDESKIKVNGGKNRSALFHSTTYYIYEFGLKSSYDDVTSVVDDFFWPMGSKHYK